MSCTEKRFLNDIKDHNITIIRDDGVNRHLRFSRNGSSFYRFDLITWDGHLTITGDCGTYIFSRIHDMFDFFVSSKNKEENKLKINPYYWSEKLRSIDYSACSHSSIMQLSDKKLMASMCRYYRAYIECNQSLLIEDRIDLRNKIREEILDLGSVDGVHEMVSCFEFNGDHDVFPDFFEEDIEDYKTSFIWNLYAIVWGIKQYGINWSK